MKVLVVGGAGYIGGCTVDTLIGGSGHEVTVYDNLMYENMYLKPVKFIAGDIRDPELYTDILPNYDAVVWLAAIVGDGACTVDPALTTEVNYTCVKRLVDSYKGRIVFTSTCSVYGKNDAIIDEEAEPNPLSLYAKTKLQAEQYLVENHKDYLIFRLGTLFGLSDQYSRLRLDLVVNILTKKATSGEDLTVFGGEQWRPLLHVKDVASAVAYGLDNSIVGLYNLSYDNFTISELARTIQGQIPGVNIVETDLAFEDMRNYKVKTDLFAATGWTPMWTLADGISELHTVMKEGRITNANNPVYNNHAYMKSRAVAEGWVS